MANIYFDKWEFERAISCMNSDPEEAKLRFEEYLKKYPKDYLAYTYYATALIVSGDFDSAQKILDFIEEDYKENEIFSNSLNKVEFLQKDIICNRIKLLSYQEKFDELYKLYLQHYEILKDSDLKPTIFYCKKKLGLLDPDKRDTNAYLFRQIVNYKESDFLDHVKKHLDEYNRTVDEPNKSIFSSNFPLYEVLKEVKKYIPSEKRIYSGYIENIYVFKYDECGRDNRKLTNYFKVICFHNTNNIITMCPSNNCENLPYIDLNYMVRNTETPKVKKLSQIEKFKLRYNRN